MVHPIFLLFVLVYVINSDLHTQTTSPYYENIDLTDCVKNIVDILHDGQSTAFQFTLQGTGYFFGYLGKISIHAVGGMMISNQGTTYKILGTRDNLHVNTF